MQHVHHSRWESGWMEGGRSDNKYKCGLWLTSMASLPFHGLTERFEGNKPSEAEIIMKIIVHTHNLSTILFTAKTINDTQNSSLFSCTYINAALYITYIFHFLGTTVAPLMMMTKLFSLNHEYLLFSFYLPQVVFFKWFDFLDSLLWFECCQTHTFCVIEKALFKLIENGIINHLFVPSSAFTNAMFCGCWKHYDFCFMITERVCFQCIILCMRGDF